MASDDDEFTAVVTEDSRWLAAHRTELWALAQAAYARSGRGAVVVIFEPAEQRDHVVMAYAEQGTWPTSGVGEQLARYNPATQMVIVCMGQLDDTEVIAGPRSYLVQYLTLAA
jgi:hypothetical protein